MQSHTFEVIVVGAGPAGSTCALYLARAGLRVLLLDKARFPRDKICADNKSWICTHVVKDLGLWKAFLKLPKQAIHNMVFSSPAGYETKIELGREKIARSGPHYNIRRVYFDDLLFQAAKRERNIKTIEQFTVGGVIRPGQQVVGVKGRDSKGRARAYYARVVVAADGSTSPTALSAGLNPVVKGRHALNIRAYYKGVQHTPDTVELHYLKGVSPGYFWIFPVDKGVCNVGLGLPSTDIERKGIKLETFLQQVIKSQPFAHRFEKAKQVSPFGVWGITVGGPRRAVHGHGIVLVGDAANTAVTFAGEGVGPAMRSGRIAARAITRAIKGNDVTARGLQRYSDDLWEVMGPENKALEPLEFLITHPRVFDAVMKRTHQNEALHKVAASIGTDYRNAAQILHPRVLWEMLR